ncbi:SDR family oxidoreductase [Paractinoplanes lichenicola]|uniref:NAD(P)H-binding protein n=1 Tax=Paractinoplanes lichenicola TaxID=2802976 RepID=A0ABS1VKM7_9ACTN|nr:NAD(P)H-binding protein [Actinoplanes lichenicola]MBL7255266.1 NAD(P)H-binding protein [Actinoplanes lichenicola]
MKVLVTGATANVGRMVVDELLARGADDIRALTVDPARAGLPSSVEVVRGFVSRPSTVPLHGVDVLYLAPHIPTAYEVCRRAADAGVRRIVDLAGAKGDHWQEIENAVEASGVPHTHLEPGEFMANATLWADQIRAGDEVRDGYAGSANAAIAQEDIAAVAAHVIVTTGHEGQSYELTGPQSLTRREKVEAIGRALGRDLRYIELTHDEAVEQLRPVMGEYAEWYLQGAAQLTRHPQAAVPTVPELLGRPAKTYEQWARDHAGLFR